MSTIHLLSNQVGGKISSLLSKHYGEHSMGSATRLIHVGSSYSSVEQCSTVLATVTTVITVNTMTTVNTVITKNDYSNYSDYSKCNDYSNYSDYRNYSDYSEYIHSTPSRVKKYLDLFPSSIMLLMSAKFCTANLDRSSTYGPSSGCSLTCQRRTQAIRHKKTEKE